MRDSEFQTLKRTAVAGSVVLTVKRTGLEFRVHDLYGQRRAATPPGINNFANEATALQTHGELVGTREGPRPGTRAKQGNAMTQKIKSVLEQIRSGTSLIMPIGANTWNGPYASAPPAGVKGIGWTTGGMCPKAPGAIPAAMKQRT
jgi:hypothetical protein